MLEVIKSGLFTTIQDKGRFGYRAYGVPTSGAMDSYAFEIANYLLGNSLTEATIEMFYGGVEIKALDDLWIALTGADVKPEIDGTPVAMWEPIKLLKGQKLQCSAPKAGVVTYLGIVGGIDSPIYLGSRSVCEKASFGRRLKNGDHIKVKDTLNMGESKSLDYREIPTYTSSVEVRVIPGPHEALFKEKSISEFYNEPFIVKQGDRMGTQLEGCSQIKMKEDKDIISEAVTFGTIQIPNNGHPTVLLADAQTTGGYPIIGSIHTDDLWRFVQLPPRGQVKFNRFLK